MTGNITAILFDMGGTLRSSIQNKESEKIAGVQQIIELIGTKASPEEFSELLSSRAFAYNQWSRKTLTELDEAGIWTKWMLPNWPSEWTSQHAIQLNQLWRQAVGKRVIFPETRQVIISLFRRGYRLGLVSNTTSSIETPRALSEMEISGCFETVLLSCVVGLRKPDPEFLLEATRRMGISPGECAYIGDRLDRDVEAARKAGFAKSIVLLSPGDPDNQYTENPQDAPDHYIHNLNELLDLFPARREKANTKPVYEVSLSTMWLKKNLPTVDDFIESARRLGFARIELNHQMDSEILSRADLEHAPISSIHEPCPADIPTEKLKEKDWLISAVDEESRQKGVAAIKRSIDFANQMGVRTIIVHSGNVSADLSLEKKLRELYGAGMKATDEYEQIKSEIIQTRARRASSRIKSVKKSLLELLEYAARYQIRLGLENRYHYYDIPIQDEMQILLELAPPHQLGYIYDVGHAQALDRLGFFPHQAWLERYAHRMFGAHIHDVQGVSDHFAAGLGEVDFDMVAKYLPDNAFRVCEFQVTSSFEQIANGLKFLHQHGCIQLRK